MHANRFNDLYKIYQMAIDLNLPEEVYAQAAFARGLAMGRAHLGQGGMFAFTQDLEKLVNAAAAAGLSDEERNLVFTDFRAGGLVGAEQALAELAEEKAAVLTNAEAIEALFKQAEAADEEQLAELIAGMQQLAEEIKAIRARYFDAHVANAYAETLAVDPVLAHHDVTADALLDDSFNDFMATADQHAWEIEQAEEYIRLQELVEEYEDLEDVAAQLTPGTPEHDQIMVRLMAIGQEINNNEHLPQLLLKLQEAEDNLKAAQAQHAAAKPAAPVNNKVAVKPVVAKANPKPAASPQASNDSDLSLGSFGRVTVRLRKMQEIGDKTLLLQRIKEEGLDHNPKLAAAFRAFGLLDKSTDADISPVASKH